MVRRGGNVIPVPEFPKADNCDGRVVVLLGDMHVMPVAEKLRANGHVVDTYHDLVPVKRWEE